MVGRVLGGTPPHVTLRGHLTTAPYAGVLEKGPRLFVPLEREPEKEGEVSEAEYSYLASLSLAESTSKDTPEEEIAQEEEEALILAEQIALL